MTASAVLRPDDVQDTIGGPDWVPVQVVATLAEPVITVADQMLLDGPLSWCAYLAAREQGLVLPPMSRAQVGDFRLPLAVWTCPAPDGADSLALTSDGQAWGWACSRAHWTGRGSTGAEVRKRPPVQQMARWTSAARHHDGLGPHKARNVTYPARLASSVEWWALGDPDRIADLLTRLRSLGRVTRHGNGRVASVTVRRGEWADRDRWRDRPLPDPDGAGPIGSVRAPHWHATRRMPLRDGAGC